MLFKYSKRLFSEELKFNYARLDHYEILDIYPNAKDKDIRKAFLMKAKKYHPDVYHGIN
jgi:curved DNA-binding protein CbpA